MMKKVGLLRHEISFDRLVSAPDGFGGNETAWGAPEDAIDCRAEFIYARGSEGIEAARLSGTASFKVRIRRNSTTTQITTDWRMRDRNSGKVYNIREADTLTVQKWIYLVVESGVAV